MQTKINEGRKLLSARVLVAASTTPGAPVTLTINPQNEILQDFKICFQAAAGTVLIKDVGFRLKVGQKLIFPALGSNDSGVDFSGGAAGWSAIPSFDVLESGDLNLIMDGPPYDMTFEFYNADVTNGVYIFVWARVTPKVDLPAAPIAADAKELKK